MGTNDTVLHNLDKIKKDPGGTSEGDKGTSDLLFCLASQSQACGQKSTHHADQHRVGVIVRALASMVMGCSSTNTDYWGEVGSICLEEEGESSLANWLTW